MQVIRKKLINCPCCKSDFFIQYRDEFYTDPLSDEEKKFLKERKEKEKDDGIETMFLT